jgi:Mg2+/Co2+ transporter CorB
MTSAEFWITIAIVVALLTFSALLSLAATGFTAASRARILQLQKQGERRAGIVERLSPERESVVASTRLGANVGNIAATALTTSAMVTLFDDVGVLYASAIMTVVIFVFGEVFPKTYAVTRPEPSVMLMARPMRLLHVVFKPLTRAADWLARRTLRLFGVRSEETEEIDAASELRDQVDLLHKDGSVEKADRDMLGGLLDLRELEVSDVMVHRTKMRTIDAGLPPADVVREVLSSPYTRMPFWRERPDNIVGVLHAKDLLRALDAAGGQADALDLDDLMLPAWFVPNTTPLPEQLKAFLKRKTHFALVVDEYGEVQGLVTLEDIIEEIVGDIKDEHDSAMSGVRPQPDGAVLVDGSIPIRDLNRAMDWALPDEEATTIAGLVIHEARAIPDTGQIFTFHGMRFQIVRKQRNRITALKIRKLDPDERGATFAEPQATGSSFPTN